MRITDSPYFSHEDPFGAPISAKLYNWHKRNGTPMSRMYSKHFDELPRHKKNHYQPGAILDFADGTYEVDVRRKLKVPDEVIADHNRRVLQNVLGIPY